MNSKFSTCKYDISIYMYAVYMQHVPSDSNKKKKEWHIYMYVQL